MLDRLPVLLARSIACLSESRPRLSSSGTGESGLAAGASSKLPNVLNAPRADLSPNFFASARLSAIASLRLKEGTGFSVSGTLLWEAVGFGFTGDFAWTTLGFAGVLLALVDVPGVAGVRDFEGVVGVRKEGLDVDFLSGGIALGSKLNQDARQEHVSCLANPMETNISSRDATIGLGYARPFRARGSLATRYFGAVYKSRGKL